ncbi:MAG: hypothetical protein R3D55_13035 [Chloroflexota bacterium]
MHQLNMFVGLDSLADNFSRGLIFLPLIFVGFWWPRKPTGLKGFARQQQVRQVGRAISILAGIAFLFAVGLLDGLGHDSGSAG